MPDSPIDLDAPEAVPPRGTARRRLLIGGAAAAAIAVGVALTRITAPKETAGPLTLREKWHLDLPDELGEAVSARVKGSTVLVVAGNGLLAADRETGAELWRRGLGPEIRGTFGTLDLDMVWFYVRLSGNSLVLPRYAEGVLTAFEVVDLPTGATRFSVPVPPNPDGTSDAVAVLATNVLLMETAGPDGEVSAHALADGRELWRRPIGDRAVTILPADVSHNRQPTGIANTGPGHAEPVEGTYLEIGGPGPGHPTSVVRIDDGGVLATWPGHPHQVGWLEIVAGALLLVDPEQRRIHGIDPLTGETTWTRPWLTGSFESKGPHWSLVDGLIIDAPPGTGGYQLIDPATGEGPEPLDLGDRKAVHIGRDTAVGIDAELAELTAVGRVSWTASLRPKGWTADGFRPEGILTGGGRLVIGGELGFGTTTQRHVWVVELETGQVGSLPDGVLAGFENGALVTATKAEPRTVRLHELGT